MKINPLATVVVLLFASASARSQIKVSVITDDSTESSKAVMTELRSKLASHPKQFVLVTNNDPNSGLIIMEECMPRKPNEDFSCFYTSHYMGLAGKTFMGGGMYITSTSGDMADDLLAAIAEDIVERWNGTVRDNAVESLQACLFLTQSSCKVPDQLESELKSKTINLSQYLQRGGLKK